MKADALEEEVTRLEQGVSDQVEAETTTQDQVCDLHFPLYAVPRRVVLSQPCASSLCVVAIKFGVLACCTIHH
jgi:hypothetical protein